MKSFKSKLGIMLFLLLTSGLAVQAQAGNEKSHGMAGLSDDQKTQIHKLRVAHLREIQPLKNQISENRVHYKTLMSSDNADISAINKNIDELGNLRGQLMKKQAAHIQDIRKILNDEQRLAFDNRLGERGMEFEKKAG